jgi:asparagine synthetase B (glutamine-hydrolysing)
MCGIAGVVSLDGHVLEPGVAGRMRDQILHRGRDGAGDYDARGVSLADRRRPSAKASFLVSSWL